jgi:hypothetical protein
MPLKHAKRTTDHDQQKAVQGKSAVKYEIEVTMIPESDGGGWASKVLNERGACLFTCIYSGTKEGAIRDATEFAKARKDFESCAVRFESHGR